jgi:RNA ligase
VLFAVPRVVVTVAGMSAVQPPTSAAPVLDELFPPGLLDEMLAARFIKIQHHPDAGLRILNYTPRAQFERVWNPVTVACRGLIVDAAGSVVARPFAKFFNLAEHPTTALPDGEVEVTEKLDGSLGILYPVGDRFEIATRGSFRSEQAVHATSRWRERYEGRFLPRPGWTYLFEIVYPANRVVVDYAGTDDLFLLGAVETATGRSVPLAEVAGSWPGPVVEVHPVRSLADALALPARRNAEGFVLRFVAEDLRVKVKHDEYVRLHRVVTDLSERRIWEALAEGVDLEAWLEAVPDEFFGFVTETRDRMLAEFASLTSEVEERFCALLGGLPEGWSRREFAAQVTAMRDFPLAKALFSRLDGKDFDAMIWHHLRPADHMPVWGRSEDAD